MSTFVFLFSPSLPSHESSHSQVNFDPNFTARFTYKAYKAHLFKPKGGANVGHVLGENVRFIIRLFVCVRQVQGKIAEYLSFTTFWSI